MRRAVFVSCFCAATSFVGVGLGQGRDPVAAEELFRAGRGLADKGDYVGACPKFAASQKLDPAPGTALNLADCEERLGEVASAWQHYRQAVEQLPPNDERVGFARQRALALEAVLPKLSVVLAPDAPPGTTVSRDGVELLGGALGQALPVNPGEHVIVASAAGKQERSFTVTLAKGEAKSIEVAPGDAAQGSSPIPTGGNASGDKAGGPGIPWRTVGWVSGAVGAAGVGAALVTGLMVLGEKGTVEDNCPTKTTCSLEGKNAADRGKTLIAVNAAAWAVGVLGIGAGAILILTHPSDEGTRTAIGPTVLPGGGGLSVAGRFQ